MRIQIRIRRGIASLLVILLFSSTIPLFTNAASVDDLTYSIEDGKVTITDCDTSASGELVIPETIGGYPVMSIKSFAFNDCSSLTNIIIPPRVTEIGMHAFANCSSLVSIELPSGLTEIGDFTFSDCTNLTSIDIPSGVTKIGDYAFVDCSSLVNVVLPTDLLQIGNCAFRMCNSLTRITIPSKVKNIEYNAFDCENLKDVYITDLTSWCQIDFETSSASPMYFAENLYLNGEKIEGELTIPSGITRIDDGAFVNCSGVTSICLPDSVTSIGDVAFRNCDSISRINIPSNVKEIGKFAFIGCDNLTEVHITSLQSWCEIDFADTYSTPMYYAKSLYINGEKLSGELNIPSEITDIKEYTFYNFVGITSINFPVNLKSIGEWSFASCDNFTSASIPEGVTTIGEHAFSGCYNLVNINIPADVTSIEEGTFSFCTSITSIEIPENVTSIGKEAFYYCSKLTSATISDSVISIGEEAFNACHDLVIYTHSAYVYNYALANSINCVYVGISSLEIEQMPTKTEYCLNEIANMSGLTIKALYSDGSNKIVTDECEVTGFDSTKAGNCTITAKYQELEVTFEVTVNADHSYDDDKDNLCNVCAHERAVESLEIKSLPQKTSYIIGDKFDFTGLVLLVNYSDGTCKEVHDGFALSGFDSSKEGTCTITADYFNEKVTFDVTVKVMPLSSIEFASQNIQIVLGDTFQSDIIYTPSNATYKEVSWKSLDDSIATVDLSGVITGISTGTTRIQAISNNGLVAECDVTVTNCKEISTSTEWFAIKNMPSGMIYKLTSNIDVGAAVLTIPSQKELIIDLNGHTIEGTDCIIINNGNLTITDCATDGAISLETESIDKTCDLIKNYGTMKLIGGTLQIISSADNKSYAMVDLHGVNNYGTLEIEDGKIFINTFVVSNSAGNFVNGIYNQSGGTVVMTGGEITVETTTETYLSGNKTYSYIYGIYNESINDLNISGATINCINYCALYGYTNTIMVQGIQNYVAADITVRDTHIDVYVGGRAYDVTGGIGGLYNLSNGIIKVDSSKIKVNAEIAQDIAVSGINNARSGSIIVGSSLDSTIENMQITTSHTNNYDSVIGNVDIGHIIVQRGQLKGYTGISNMSTSLVELGVNDGLVDSDTLIIDATGDILLSTSQINIYDGTFIGNLDAAVPVSTPEGWLLSNSNNNDVNKYVLVGKPLEAIKLDKTEIQIVEENEFTLTVQYTPSDTTDDKTVIWISSDETVATVDAYGNVTARKPGTAIITATVGSISTSCKVIVLSNNWIKDSVGWWYRNSDGSYPYNCWKMIEGEWYYFNASGYRVTGWQLLGTNWYYMNADGVMLTDWQHIDNSWYYFNGSGEMVTGWQLIGGAWYYFHGSGAMASNQWIGNYYLQANGVMATNQWVGNYYVQSNGVYVSTPGWLLVGSNWYYLGAGGIRLTSRWIGSYYVKANGVMATNEWIGNYYVDSNGVYVSRSGWLAVGGNWYYLGTGGVKLTNQWVDNYYYVGSNGVMATNQVIAGLYWVGNDGKWIPDYGADAYLRQLKTYITNYGWINSDGNDVISSSYNYNGTTYTTGIVYYRSTDELHFMFTSNNENGTLSSVTMLTRTINNSVLYPDYKVVIGSYASQAIATLYPTTYTISSELYFRLAATNGFTESQIQDSANAELQLAFLKWSDLIEEAGLTMKQIGFSAYIL